jgi:hypothetical protein
MIQAADEDGSSMTEKLWDETDETWYRRIRQKHPETSRNRMSFSLWWVICHQFTDFVSLVPCTSHMELIGVSTCPAPQVVNASMGSSCGKSLISPQSPQSPQYSSTCSLCLYGLLILREILRVVLGLCASLLLYLVLKLWDLRKTNNCMNFRARPFRSAAWRSQRLVSKLLLESKYVQLLPRNGLNDWVISSWQQCAQVLPTADKLLVTWRAPATDRTVDVFPATMTMQWQWDWFSTFQHLLLASQHLLIAS